jgi:ADP-ribose pyrophosphatase YjhB (NUDIX family)
MVWKPNVTVAAVVERDGAFLLVQERSQGRLVLNQPAGHLEPGESLLDAVRRETLEETAWHFEPTALVGIYRWPHPSKSTTYLRFAFAGRVDGQEHARELDNGIEGTVWLSVEEIRAQRALHRSPQVMACVCDYLAGRHYPLDCLRDYDDYSRETGE